MNTLVETFVVSKTADDAEVFYLKTLALRRLYLRVPEGATLSRVPSNLDDRHRREVHLYKVETHQTHPMEIAIREDKDTNGDVIYEYSTDYEL